MERTKNRPFLGGALAGSALARPDHTGQLLRLPRWIIPSALDNHHRIAPCGSRYPVDERIPTPSPTRDGPRRPTAAITCRGERHEEDRQAGLSDRHDCDRHVEGSLPPTTRGRRLIIDRDSRHGHGRPSLCWTEARPLQGPCRLPVPRATARNLLPIPV